VIIIVKTKEYLKHFPSYYYLGDQVLNTWVTILEMI